MEDFCKLIKKSIFKILINGMAKSPKTIIVTDEVIMSKVYYIRGNKVMLDEELAALYEVSTKRLNEQVKRNMKRFPDDFMFQLTMQEFNDLKSQFATSSWGGRRTAPYAFTEHGVLMLSSILTSERAVSVNIRIMRIYTKMRKMIFTHKDILIQLEKIEKKVMGHDEDIQLIFNYFRQLLKIQKEPRPRIGFRRQDEKE